MSAITGVVQAGTLMDVDDAKRLDTRIRRMAGTLRDHLQTIAVLVDEAKRGQIHIALGFASWTAYLADALGGELELTTESRRSVVALLADEGVSQRAIAEAVGVSQATVGRDLQVNQDGSPEGAGECSTKIPDPYRRPSTVTGRDGKSYSQQQPARPRRRPRLTDDIGKLCVELARVNGKMRKLLDDDRFERNREVIMNRLRPHVAIGLELLQRLDAAGAASSSAGKP